MLLPVLLLVSGLFIKQDQAPLRAACSESEELVARLPNGLPVELRFAVADGSNCYKIAATVDGKQVVGYVPASALDGLDRFESERRNATSADSIRLMAPIETASRGQALRTNDGPLLRASQLLEGHHPSDALAALSPLLQRSKRSPEVLMLAGLAAYRGDDLRHAQEYWKEAQDLQPNPILAKAYARVQREATFDHSDNKLIGMRVQLRYEGTTVGVDTARTMIAVLDQEIDRISTALGCPTDERIPVIVQNRADYLKGTNAAEWSAGMFDGRIRVTLLDGNSVGTQTRRAFAHEIVHACLATLGTWPAWLHEGLAQHYSGDALPPALSQQLQRQSLEGKLPKLENVKQDWSKMNAGNAQTAYQMALLATDSLLNAYSEDGLRNLLRNPKQLPQITADLDRRLGL